MHESVWYLTHDDIAALKLLLEELPALADLLVHLEYNRERHGHKPAGRAAPRSTPPGNVSCLSALEHLRTELTMWVMYTAYRRGIEVSTTNSIDGLCAWLDKHLYDLAQAPPPILRERTALTCIKEHRDHIKSLTTPEGDPTIGAGHTTEEALTKARRQLYTAAQIEALAKNLGEQGKGITKRRVAYLDETRRISVAHRTKRGINYYTLGDVLDAHNQRRVML